jgi:hypothetical protein
MCVPELAAAVDAGGAGGRNRVARAQPRLVRITRLSWLTSCLAFTYRLRSASTSSSSSVTSTPFRARSNKTGGGQRSRPQVARKRSRAAWSSAEMRRKAPLAAL